MMKLDGVEEELENLKAKRIKNEREVTLIMIINVNGALVIDSNVYGLHVEQEDDAVYVQAATYYRGKLCGLCSDYNLDRQHEFHTPDGCHHNTEWAYARNFMIPDDKCTVPDADPLAGTPHCAK